MRILLLILLAFSWKAQAQTEPQVLTFEAFMEQVMEDHPYAYRASIVAAMGTSELLKSRGAFDPKLFGNADQKYYDNQQYYSQLKGGLKIPTWFGLSAETGYSLNEGVYLNPESRQPDAGLWYAGLRLELGNGLIIDERRAALEKAKLNQTSSELERKIMLNELRRDASLAYFSWQQASQQLSIYELAYENAAQRYDAVKNAAIFGDRPYIDTVEASITIQNRQVELLKAQNALDNAELKVEMYLWSEGFIPLEIDNAVPSSRSQIDSLNSLSTIDSLIMDHPYLKINNLQYQQNRVDLMLKKEQLKPQLTLKYNALSEPINGNPLSEYSTANYSWGATFAYPILTRKERGSVQLARLKLEDQDLKTKMTLAEVNNKVRSSLNNYLQSIEQLAIKQQLQTNAQLLYDAERELFNLGESSVFMINSRESTWLKAQIEAIEEQIRRQALKAELEFQTMLYF